MNHAIVEECTIEHVVKALHQRAKPGPATSEAIRKALPAPIRPSKNALDSLLQDTVRSGQLWEYSTKKPPVTYWTQSPIDLALCRIEALLSQDDKTESDLTRALKVREFDGLIEPAAFLSQLVSEGRIYLVPKSPGTRSVRYSLKAMDVTAVTDSAWRLTERKLKAKDCTQPELQRTLKPVLHGLLEPDEFLHALVADRKIFELPKTPKAKSAKYSLGPPNPTADVSRAITKLVSELDKIAKKFDREMTELVELAQTQLRTHASGTISAVATQTSTPTDDVSLPAEPSNDNALKERLLQAMSDINPRSADGELVLIRDLRRFPDLLSVEKHHFDNALLEMFRDRRIVLSKHSTGNAFEPDRVELVTDGEGNFYNTVALWRD